MKAGEYVEIKTEDSVMTGLLIPRPDMLKKGIIVLKLDNGYNVGIEEAKIKSSKVIKKLEKVESKEHKLKINKDLPTVAVLSSGGTISSKVDYRTGGVYADYDANDFLKMCPELADVANLKADKIMALMSEDADLKVIQKMAKSLLPYLEDDSIKGIVLTLGTDMFHYIAAGLSFMLQDLPKPVVLTASQRSIDRGSSDAFMNLSCAVKTAAEWKGAEVISCMHGSSDDEYCLLIRGTKVRKMHTSRRDAFRPINELPFAKVNYPSLEIEEINSNYHLRGAKLKVGAKLSDKVALVYVYPGMDADVIDFYVKKGYEALIIAGTALGHVPTDGESNLLPALEKAIKKGVVIAIATQTLYGRTHRFVYTNLRKLSVTLGCLYSEDLTPETAYMKMSWVLANTSKDKVKEVYESNILGEINEIIDAESYLY